VTNIVSSASVSATHGMSGMRATCSHMPSSIISSARTVRVPATRSRLRATRSSCSSSSNERTFSGSR
jgi:hypothetical protein